MFTLMMLLLRIVLLPKLLTTVLATTANGKCQLLTNTSYDTNNSVIICGGQGWKAVETSVEAGACHVAPAGNAYCEKEIGCMERDKGFGTTKLTRILPK
jgi:hypothetical protein